MRRFFSIMLLAFMIFPAMAVVSGCSKNSSENSGYEQITQDKAKEYMDTQTDLVILDTRTQEEFSEGHIPGAMLIPYDEIDTRAEKELPDKDKLILVYCRSGRRSKIAAEALAHLGYTNVKEFGGIIDWEYEIVR